VEQIDMKTSLRTPDQLCAILNKTHNHEVFLAPEIKSHSEENITSRGGIKSWHRALFSSGTIKAWQASSDSSNNIPEIGKFELGSKGTSVVLTAAANAKNRIQAKQPAANHPLPYANTSCQKKRD